MLIIDKNFEAMKRREEKENLPYLVWSFIIGASFMLAILILR